MKKFKTWLKEQSQKPRFFAKVLAVVLIIVALLIPKNYNDNEEQSDTSSSYTQQSTSDEEEEKSTSKYEFHIGTSNLIALVGGIIALAIVKNKEKSFLNKHDKK